MKKINNNYFNKFDYSKELNSNNQYFSTGLCNRPFLKLPGIELVNDVKAGDMSALKKYLAIRMAIMMIATEDIIMMTYFYSHYYKKT